MHHMSFFKQSNHFIFDLSRAGDKWFLSTRVSQSFFTLIFWALTSPGQYPEKRLNSIENHNPLKTKTKQNKHPLNIPWDIFSISHFTYSLRWNLHDIKSHAGLVSKVSMGSENVYHQDNTTGELRQSLWEAVCLRREQIKYFLSPSHASLQDWRIWYLYDMIIWKYCHIDPLICMWPTCGIRSYI